MKLDRTFQNDVKKVFKNCERSDLRRKMRAVTELLSNRYQYDNAIRDHGRGIVAICTAVAVLDNSTEYESPERTWAQEVINLLDDSERRIARTFGNFWLHPAILADNMNFLRKVTTQN